MKRLVIICLFTLISFTSSNLIPKYDFTPVVNAFSCSNVNFSQYNLNGWVKFNEMDLDNERLKKVTEEIYEYIKPGDNGKVLFDNEDKTFIIKEEDDKNNITVIVKNTYNYISGKYETSAIVDITHNGYSENISDIGEDIFSCLKNYGINPSVNMSLSGYLSGRIEEYEKNQVLNIMLKKLNAKKVEGVDSSNLTSISGYTKSIPQYIISNSKKININAASRYNSYENKTFFWWGTPLINIEY